jgi:hypothetical protein
MTALDATLFLFMSVVAAEPQEPAQAVNRDAKTIKAFSERVDKFVALHRKLESTLPKLPAETDPDRVYAHQQALAKLLAQARAGARSGDLFNEETRRVFRRIIAVVVRGPEGRELVAEILDENTASVPLRVNGPYPSDVPFSTVPPRLIAALPPLPEELEYRFVGRQLILFDLHAQTIVDFMTNALP